MVDVRVTNTDQKSYIEKKVESVLARQERENKNKYLADCIQERTDFTPFVVSVDGLLGREETLYIKQLARHLRDRWEKPISQILNFIHTKLSISILKASHQCIRGSMVTDEQRGRGIGQDGTSLGLFKSYEN